MRAARELIGEDTPLRCSITGSAGLGVAKAADIDFVQEVFATRKAVGVHVPQADVVIELGGEDAKIIYFDNGIEQRMNGTCAGGTGAFIDQMATLLHTDASASTSSRLTPPPSIPSPVVAAFLPRPTCSRCSTRVPAPKTVAASIFQPS